MEFHLPRSTLPDNKIKRRVVLDEYFPQGLVPLESLTDQGWKVSCFNPTDPSYFVDPLIEQNLHCWPGNIRLDSIESFWRIYKNASFSFIDSWSLNYWSLFFNWLELNKKPIPLNLTVIHIDDHLDQATPHLTWEKDSWQCAFSKKKFDFYDPLSVQEAIITKSVGIGSFFAPLLHQLPSVNILHLRYSHKGNSDRYSLKCTFNEDELLVPGKNRPALARAQVDSQHQYTIVSEPFELVDKIKDSELIFLHIDCDAFNNRYNGDSLWYKQKPSIDLSLNQIKEKIDELFYLLNPFSHRIYMNFALSPGFFPSEYWIPTFHYTFEKGLEHNLIRDDDFSEYLKINHPKAVTSDIFN